MSPNATVTLGGSAARTDLLGTPLDSTESTLLDVYQALKRLVADDSIAPCAASNARAALAAVSLVLTDLAVEFEPLTDLNC
ncbi:MULTISPECIES: hypothetical protein [unclassified Gordonia (in: high G+C Gram-positive bacteria)]|uniref:hypothetical protein n=1 Tax=unclassified Gordonia (in: high G+C Gram-positive bacteria) TaxID=2657482 RepID=UPI0009AD3099|nr:MULTISPECIES: hypothetical protein [unclassified Gordonia (in: high G+C Gram-positive bacteria)]MDF3280781.1 hypothetical protein [Gordonia sp. N1V]OPX11870.1 hypothetical protein B1964_22065 [Gordonia sp. i37]